MAIANESFDPAGAVKTAVNASTTMLTGVPAMCTAMLEVVRKAKLSPDKFSFRCGFIAGSPVAPSLIQEVESAFGVSITNALGMTELSPASFVPPLDADFYHRVISVGKVMPHESAKIVHPSTGKTAPIGTRGELCVTGYNVCAGYFKNAEKTNELIRIHEDGLRWIHTGDECYFDEDGFCYITGRIKDIIIRGGENIYPGEIENRLVARSDIAEASVFGVPDERYGEAVAAVLRAEKKSTDEDVQSWVAEELSRHKVPKYVFWLGDHGFGQDFPRTGSGKIQKFALRKIAEEALQKRGRARL
jgi:mevalonyl-CoA ligase